MFCVIQYGSCAFHVFVDEVCSDLHVFFILFVNGFVFPGVYHVLFCHFSRQLRVQRTFYEVRSDFECFFIRFVE